MRSIILQRAISVNDVDAQRCKAYHERNQGKSSSLYQGTVMKKPTKKEITQFREEAIAILREFGFVATPDGWRDYQAQTLAGPLSVSIEADWLACVFHDEKLAATFNLGGRLNTHSGKWNWDGGIDGLKWFKASLDHLFGEELVANDKLKLVPLKVI